MNPTREYWTGKHVMYRFFDEADDLLYIGASSNLPARMDNHRAASPWYAEVARLGIQVFRSGVDALDAERTAIRMECPRYNVRSSGKRTYRERPNTRRLSEDGRDLMIDILRARRMTVRELAQRCGDKKHRSGIAHLLSGARVTCNAALAERIQEVLLGSATEDRIFLPRLRSVRAAA